MQARHARPTLTAAASAGLAARAAQLDDGYLRVRAQPRFDRTVDHAAGARSRGAARELPALLEGPSCTRPLVRSSAPPAWNHTRAEVGGFPEGLYPVDPGLIAAQSWGGGWHDVPVTPSGPVYVLRAVAREPLPGTAG